MTTYRIEYQFRAGTDWHRNVKLILNGKKLKGEWHMFRIKSDEEKPVWLIAKSKVAAKPISAKRDDQSVLTKRTMSQIAKANDRVWQSNRTGAG